MMGEDVRRYSDPLEREEGPAEGVYPRRFNFLRCCFRVVDDLLGAAHVRFLLRSFSEPSSRDDDSWSEDGSCVL